jgi:hypothetical protein
MRERLEGKQHVEKYVQNLAQQEISGSPSGLPV